MNIQEAVKELILWAEQREYKLSDEHHLYANTQAPTGDDYNDLLTQVLLLKKCAGINPEDDDDRDRAYRAAAKEQATDDLEVDDNAIVSRGDDPGAFVAAWLWISNEDAGLPNE